MGRRLPFEANPSIHPALSLSLFVAWVTMIISVIAALCSARPRKPTAEKPSQPSPSQTQTPENPQVETTLPLPLPLPPALMKPTEIAQEQAEPSPPEAKDTFTNASPNNQHVLRPSYTSTTSRNLMVSLSMKLPRALSRIRTVREEYRQQKGADKHGDSLCTKTIILGERCRVPKGDDDAIIYDESGNRIAAYPSRTPRSLPVSRSNSYIDLNAVPTSKPVS